MANAAAKQKAQARLSNAPKSDKAVADEVKAVQAKQAAAKVPNAQTLPKDSDEGKTTAELTAKTKVRGGPSIRGLITGMISQGKSTEQITEAVVTQFPDSQAAAKPSKHISFYRSRMKKENPDSVPAKEAKAQPVVQVSAKKGTAKKQVVTEDKGAE